MMHLRLFALMFVLLAAGTWPWGVSAANSPSATLLPAECAKGWAAADRVAEYTPENLYKYIDGEAELYLPYGFRRAETALYADPSRKNDGIVVNLFRMGSPLDAFGVYSNYRTPETEVAAVGTEGFVEESQLMFYQGSYFIQLSESGSLDQPSSLFLACAQALSKRLPEGLEKPRELAFLDIPGLIKRSERYYAQGLLGYPFLGRGLTGEAASPKGKAKVIVVLGDSPEAIKKAIEAYGKYLEESKAVFEMTQVKSGLRLAATDPLYKGILLQQSGRFAAAVANLPDPADGEATLTDLLVRLPKE